jgi:hypothetical protein
VPINHRLRADGGVRFVGVRRSGLVGVGQAADAGRDDPRLEHRDPGQQRRERRPAIDPAQPGRRPGGPAVDQQRLSADPRLLHPSRRVTGRHLRPAAGVRAGRGRVRPDLPAVRDRAIRWGPHRLPGAPGRRGSAAHTELAGRDHRHLPGEGARSGDRDVDGVGNDRRGARSARRRIDPERRDVALDLRDQRATRDRLSVPDHESRPCGCADRTGAPGRRNRSTPVRAGPRRRGVRFDRAAPPGVVQPGRERLPGGRGARLRRLPDPRVAHGRPDAQARPVQESQTSRSATSRRWRSTVGFRRSSSS